MTLYRLSCEIGLPCLVPFDALELKPGEEAALPADFISKLRIVLYVSRINDILGDNTSKDTRNRMRLVRLLEKDVNSLASELRQSSAQWNPTVEFVYLCILLNLYSFTLRWSSAAATRDPDNTIIQSSAAHAACQLIELYASPSLPFGDNSPAALSVPQRYFPKHYLRFNAVALFMLLKISALNQISLRELGEVDDAIRMGHGAIMACSSSDGDECHRAAGVVEVLCKKGIIDSTRVESPVESRLGASLWLELVATAIRWRRLNSKKRPRPEENGTSDINVDKDIHTETQFPSTSISRIPASADAMMAVPTTADHDAARLALADLQANANMFPFSIEDWSTYLDVTQADLGLGYESGWWGGVGG